MKKLLLKLASRLAGVTPEFWPLLQPVLFASGKQFLGDAAVAAEPLVLSLEGLGLPSAEKRGEAVNRLIAAFLKDGKHLEVSVANLAVELAVQKLHAAVPTV